MRGCPVKDWRIPFRLDDCRSCWLGKTIDLLKIDVEGSEREVLAGAQNMLHEDRPRLIMFESLGGRVDPEIATSLESASYLIFQLNDRGQSDSTCASAQNLFAVPAEQSKAIR
jgi:hypothetical protein